MCNKLLQLVLSRRSNVKDYCLQVAIYLLRLEASSLYISSFSDQEITQMNRIVSKLKYKMKYIKYINHCL